MSCLSLVPFALWPAFPTSDYYGTSATFAGIRRRWPCPRSDLPSLSASRTLPAFTVFRWVGWCPALLLQPCRAHNAVLRAATSASPPSKLLCRVAIYLGFPRAATARINQVRAVDA